MSSVRRESEVQRSSSSWRWRVLAGLGAVVAAVLLRGSRTAGVCADDNAACHFSPSYFEAREKFREAVDSLQERGCGCVVVETGPIGAVRSLEGEDLTIDAVTLRFGSPNRTLVHLSGVHGVEGFAGSAVQVAALRRWARDESCPTDTEVVMVHAVNPYGMHHLRRTNEHNVDLNRNLLTEEEFASLDWHVNEEADYAALSKVFNPLVYSECRFWVAALRSLATQGFLRVKRALVSGQYTQPAGLFYGGDRLQTSHLALKKLLLNKGQTTIIDVHTGLGPYGVDTIIPSSTAAARALLGEMLYGSAADADGAASGYDGVRGSTSRYGGLALTQEFGTISGILVARALCKENALWHQGTKERGLRHAFDPQDIKWRTSVITRGLDLITKVLSKEAAPPSPKEDAVDGIR